MEHPYFCELSSHYSCLPNSTPSGVARGGFGVQTPHLHQSRFFHSRKVTVIKYYSLSLTTQRTINSHDLRKTNHWGESIVYQ